jgi:hypothetical protein
VHRRCGRLVEGCRDVGAGVVPQRAAGALARDLPETALRATSRRPTTQPLTAPPTCAVVWAREVMAGVVNYLRIDGKWFMARGHP